MKKILDFFKNKPLCLYLSLGACVVGIVVTVFYAVYSAKAYGKINGGADIGSHFNALIFVLLLLGTLSCALPIIKPQWKFATLVPVLFFSAAFGYYINDRLIMIEETFNKIYGMMESGGDFGTVIAIFVLTLIPIITLIVAAFTDESKSLGKKQN